MSRQTPEALSDQTLVSKARQGVWHISDVLPVVLARIPAPARDDQGRSPSPTAVIGRRWSTTDVLPER